MVLTIKSLAVASMAGIAAASSFSGYNSTITPTLAPSTTVVTKDVTTLETITTTLTICTKAPHCSNPVVTVIVTDCPVVYPGDKVTYSYTTYETITLGKTVTVTEPCSTIIPPTVTPITTIFTTPGFPVKPTQPIPTPVTVTSYTTKTTVTNGQTVTVTEPCSTYVTVPTPTTITSYTTKTTVSEGVTVTVTEPCSTYVTIPPVVPTTEIPKPTTEVPKPTTEVPKPTTPKPEPPQVTKTTVSEGSTITFTEPCHTCEVVTPTAPAPGVTTVSTISQIKPSAPVTSVPQVNGAAMNKAGVVGFAALVAYLI